MSNFERPNIRDMAGYGYGEQPADEKTIKLNTNEHPHGPSPRVQEVLNQFDANRFRRYPPATALAFRTAAARLHKVTPQHIIATHGGDELLRLVMTTFADPGSVIAMTEPTYSLYPVLARIQGCEVHKVPLAADWTPGAGFADSANSAGASLTLVVNPHAPSGKLLSRVQILELANSLNSLLLVDEAYVDFVDPELAYGCLDLVLDRDNVIFLRSLSKGYGLAGLRFGYGVGHPSLITPMLEKTRDSYNLDVLSQELATAAILDQEYASASWAEVRSERSRVRAALDDLGCPSPDSEANFLLAEVPQAEATYQALKLQGILVRYFNTPGMDTRLRITIGTPVENDQLLAALAAILSTGA